MSNHRVLDVGQCDYDHDRISTLLRSQFGVEVVRAHSTAEALDRLRSEAFDLMLVNRIFDHTAEDGFDLIRKAKANAKTSGVPVMLVSNFPESQAEAVAVGALPGFGKAALLEAVTKDRLEKVLGGVAVA